MDPDRLKPFTLITVTAFAALQLTYEPHVDTPPEQTLPVVGTLPVHVQEEILALAPKAADTAHIREFWLTTERKNRLVYILRGQ